MTNIESLNCASPRCVLGPNHEGTHTEHTEPFVVNACTAQLHRLLTTPDLPCDAADTLRSADNVFTTLREACRHWRMLEGLLRIGSALPEPWRRA